MKGNIKHIFILGLNFLILFGFGALLFQKYEKEDKYIYEYLEFKRLCDSYAETCVQDMFQNIKTITNYNIKQDTVFCTILGSATVESRQKLIVTVDNKKNKLRKAIAICKYQKEQE